MKKHLSLFMLFVKQRIYKELLVLAGLAAVNYAGFKLFGETDTIGFARGTAGYVYAFAFMAAYFALMFICVPMSQKRSNSLYTLQRLSISERWVFIWECLASALCFLLLMAAEILILLCLAGIFEKMPGFNQGPQGILIALFDSEFFYGLIPLGMPDCWVRNGVFVFCCGVLCAYTAMDVRHGKKKTVGTLFCIFLVLGLWLPISPRDTVSVAFHMCVSLLLSIGCFFWAMVTAHGGKGGEYIEDEYEEN